MRDYWQELFNVLRARRLCYQTIETYKNELRKFLGFCYSEGLIPEEIPHEGLIKYLADSPSESQSGLGLNNLSNSVPVLE